MKPFNGESFSAKLREAIAAHEFTQTEVADKIHEVVQTVNNWVNYGNIRNGKKVEALPNAEQLYRLCETLDTPSDWLLGRSAHGGDHKASGITWCETTPSIQVSASYRADIKRGKDIFHRIVEDHMTIEKIRQMDEFSNLAPVKIGHLLKMALATKAIEFTGVDPNETEEKCLKEKYGAKLHKVIVADLDLPSDHYIDLILRTEAVAFLAAKEAMHSLVPGAKVGLTGGTTIARFADLVPYAANNLAGVTWYPLLNTNMGWQLVNAPHANNVVARIANNQPASTGKHLSYISMRRRDREYFRKATGDEKEFLQNTQKVLEEAKSVDTAYISVGVYDYNWGVGKLYLGMPEINEIYEKGLTDEERRRCVGDVLLYLIDENGDRLGNSEAQRKNDDLIHSIGLAELRNIQHQGAVWILAGRASKTSVIRAAIKSGLANSLVIDKSIAVRL